MNSENYHPFGVCLAVFAVLLISSVFQTMGLIEQKNLIKTAGENTQNLQEKYNAAQKRVELLIGDLVKLSQTNPNAKKIVEEFNIKVASSAESAMAPASSPAVKK